MHIVYAKFHRESLYTVYRENNTIRRFQICTLLVSLFHSHLEVSSLPFSSMERACKVLEPPIEIEKQQCKKNESPLGSRYKCIRKNLQLQILNFEVHIMQFEVFYLPSTRRYFSFPNQISFKLTNDRSIFSNSGIFEVRTVPLLHLRWNCTELEVLWSQHMHLPLPIIAGISLQSLEPQFPPYFLNETR